MDDVTQDFIDDTGIFANYEPYGEDWQKEMMKLKKADMIRISAGALREKESQLTTQSDRIRELEGALDMAYRFLNKKFEADSLYEVIEAIAALRKTEKETE